MKKRPAFTLAEVLTGMYIGAAVCLAGLQIAKYASEAMERSSERTLAWETGERALSIIGARVLNAALCITFDRPGGVFSQSFGNVPSSPLPSKWMDRGPLQILDWKPNLSLAHEDPDDPGVFRGAGITVLYAVPSGLKILTDDEAPLRLNSGESKPVRFAPGKILERAKADGLEISAAVDSLRSCVGFPLTKMPLRASYKALNNELTLTAIGAPGLSATVYPSDEMHYLRAEQFYAENGCMCSKDLDRFWQPLNGEIRLDGVLGMWFEWRPRETLLRAWVLTTGGSASPGQTVRPEEWPEQAWQKSFERHEVVVTGGSWRLKNMRAE